MTLDIYKHVGNTLGALESSLRLAISNANNFNTPGFKYSFATFTTVFSEVISPGTTTTNPMVSAGGMTLGATSTDFSQGSIGFGTSMDMAISGEGFFTLSQSEAEFDTASPQVYTRNGRFQVDFSNTYITDSFGRKLYGFPLDDAGNVTSKTQVAMQTKGNTDIGFTTNGVLVANFQARKDAIAAGESDPPEHIPLFKVALTTFKNKQGLVVTEGGALQATVASGDAFEPEESGVGVFGTVLPEATETSNVDVAKVSLDMALLNRGFSAIQGVIQDVNKITQDLIGKLVA